MIFWLLHPLLRDFTLVDVNPDVKTETAATFSKVLKLREISTAAQPIMINHRNRPFQNHEHIISIWKSRCYFFSRVVSHSISYKFRRKMSRSCRLIVLHYHWLSKLLSRKSLLKNTEMLTRINSIWKSRCYIFSRVVFHSIIYKFRRKMSRGYRYVHYLNSAHGL